VSIIANVGAFRKIPKALAFAMMLLMAELIG